MAVANVVVNPNPSVSATASQTSVCLTDGMVTLAGIPSGGSFSGAGVSGATFDPSIGAGTYTVNYSYTDANGCTGSNDINMLVSVCAGIKNIQGNAMLSIYPNPAQQSLFISNPDGGDLKFRMYDVNGKVIMEKELTKEKEELDLSRLSSGTYFVEILNSGVRVYKTPLIKQ
jgi:hypothetical protein